MYDAQRLGCFAKEIWNTALHFSRLCFYTSAKKGFKGSAMSYMTCERMTYSLNDIHSLRHYGGRCALSR